MPAKKPRTVEHHTKSTNSTRRSSVVHKYQPAKDFCALIDLVRTAEQRLIEAQPARYKDVEERIHVIRGIYYGTTWSADYQVEHSEVRNMGFQAFTGSNTPYDPRSLFVDNLFESMQKSRDVADDGRAIDFGHLMIGMDARRNLVSRNVVVPAQGGTGLELCTWLGDLGGGAGMLARDRVTSPQTLAINRFKGLDFGGSNNLEGDVAGYLVGRDQHDDDSLRLDLANGKMIADALDEYLSPAAIVNAWNSRSTVFLKALGGKFKGALLANRKELINRLTQQIAEFGSMYLLNRLRQKNQLTANLFGEACLHLVGASQEVAQIFVDALVHSHKNQGAKIEAHLPGPVPTPKASEITVGRSAWQALRSVKELKNIGQSADKFLRDAQKHAKRLFPW